MSCNSFWLIVTYYHIELLIFCLTDFLVSPGAKLLLSPAAVIPLIPTPEQGGATTAHAPAGAGGGRAGGCLPWPRPGQGNAPGAPVSPHAEHKQGTSPGPLKSFLRQLTMRSKSCHQPLLVPW